MKQQSAAGRLSPTPSAKHQRLRVTQNNSVARNVLQTFIVSSDAVSSASVPFLYPGRIISTSGEVGTKPTLPGLVGHVTEAVSQFIALDSLSNSLSTEGHLNWIRALHLHTPLYVDIFRLTTDEITE